jgi:hypothetical protein
MNAARIYPLTSIREHPCPHYQPPSQQPLLCRIICLSVLYGYWNRGGIRRDSCTVTFGIWNSSLLHFYSARKKILKVMYIFMYFIIVRHYYIWSTTYVLSSYFIPPIKKNKNIKVERCLKIVDIVSILGPFEPCECEYCSWRFKSTCCFHLHGRTFTQIITLRAWKREQVLPETSAILPISTRCKDPKAKWTKTQWKIKSAIQLFFYLYFTFLFISLKSTAVTHPRKPVRYSKGYKNVLLGYRLSSF